MAQFLKRFKFAWKELDEALNKIADAVNFNAPLEGTGIHLDEKGGRGTSINRTDLKGGQSNDSQSGTQDPHLLATSIQWHGVKWQDVTVVDPSTCAQSTLSVLTLTHNDSDVVEIFVQYPFWVAPSQGTVHG